MTAVLFSSYGEDASNVTIGKQVWMTENLNVDKFRNGDAIPEAKTEEEWRTAGEKKQPAWCYYYNDTTNGAKYGKLYNWYAVNDSRGLAPKGWHVPSEAEWTQLIDYLGGKRVAGGKMKSTTGWMMYANTYYSSNSSGFSGLPGGSRNEKGGFLYIGYAGTWWSSTEKTRLSAWFHELYYSNSRADRFGTDKIRGLSVRCIRD